MSVIEKIIEVATGAAIDMMAAKAGCNPAEIVACVTADPTGNTARYLATLIATAVNEVPARLA